MAVEVVKDGVRRGEARFCVEHTRPSPRRGIVPIVVALLVVWGAAGLIARRLARPLMHLAQVARDLGDGKLATRASVRHHEPAEVQVFAAALNDMAGRIESHVNDQRTLLAGVSHELRTPLGHVRLLVELAREGASAEAAKRLDEIEREVVEMDDLVGQLLASARLDFSLDEPRRLDVADIARRALERAGLAPGLLAQEGAVDVDGDPTLLARAIANLLENARTHAGGATALHVRRERDVVTVVVEDAGAGLPAGDPGELFAPFVRQAERPEKGSLGLGLYLVRRIALAHGGSIVAENKPTGGARVGFRIPAPRG
jgi:two-component system, OmpR family, sensor kinase